MALTTITSAIRAFHSLMALHTFMSLTFQVTRVAKLLLSAFVGASWMSANTGAGIKSGLIAPSAPPSASRPVVASRSLQKGWSLGQSAPVHACSIGSANSVTAVAHVAAAGLPCQ